MAARATCRPMLRLLNKGSLHNDQLHNMGRLHNMRRLRDGRLHNVHLHHDIRRRLMLQCRWMGCARMLMLWSLIEPVLEPSSAALLGISTAAAAATRSSIGGIGASAGIAGPISASSRPRHCRPSTQKLACTSPVSGMMSRSALSSSTRAMGLSR